MISLELTFYILSSVVWLTLLFSFLSLLRVNVKGKIFYILPIGMATLTIPIYALFLTSKSYFCAMLFDGLYFICTDFLCYFMLLFILCYSLKPKAIKLASLAFIPPLLVDSVSLIVNVWTQHSFELTKVILEDGDIYWSCAFTGLHYIHLGFCYFMAALAFILLIRSIVCEPSFYKTKYIQGKIRGGSWRLFRRHNSQRHLLFA